MVSRREPTGSNRGNYVSDIRPSQGTPTGPGTHLTGSFGISNNQPSDSNYTWHMGSDDGGDYKGGARTLVPTPDEPNTPNTPPPLTPEQLAQQAYDRALNWGTQQIGERGLNQGLVDQYGLLDIYKGRLDQRRTDLGANAGDYSQYGVENLFNDSLGVGQTKYRADLLDAIRGAGPDGFEYTTFADTADDALLQAFLDTQKSDAQLVLDRAKARGQLNDVGYGRAVTELGTQGTGALGTLQGIGGGVLSDYRNQLKTVRDNGLNTASTASFNQPFNAGSIVDRLNALKTDLTGRMAGDITKAIGGTQFYTPSVAIGKGGTTQGTINPSRINYAENPLLAAFQTGSARKMYGNNTGSRASTGAF